MERRTHMRKPVDVSVYLSCSGYRPVRGTAVDISHSGIYVKMNPLYLPTNKPLNLMFALHIDSSNIVHMHRVSAVITRSAADGVGMAFCKKGKAGPSNSRRGDQRGSGCE